MCVIVLVRVGAGERFRQKIIPDIRLNFQIAIFNKPRYYMLLVRCIQNLENGLMFIQRQYIEPFCEITIMVGKTKKPTTEEKQRMDVLKHHVPCIPCLMIGRTSLPEVHHLVSGMRRLGHDKTISLCLWHHRAIPLENWSGLDGSGGGAKQATSGLLGPSLAWGRKSFEGFFGPEALLVRIADGILDAYRRRPWLDYNVPYSVKAKARDYWRERVIVEGL